MKNTTKTIREKIFATILLVAVFFFGVPGLELFPKATSILKSNKAEAANPNYGREMRTAEFLLSLGTETTARATAVPSYTTAAGWTTTKPALSSGDVVKLFGTNIKVDQAELEVGYYTLNTAVSRQDITFNASKSSTEATTTYAGEYNGTSLGILSAGGLTNSIMTVSDVTSFFDRQTDSDFSSGLNVSAGVSVTGPTRFLTTVKLIITYSVDVDLTSHSLVKTVKLPLLSATNRGTKDTTCAANTTCTFNVDFSKIPELTDKIQIQSVSVDLYAQEGATTVAATTSLRMSGGGGLTTFTFADTYTDAYTAKISWNPLKDTQFTVGGMESIDVVNGTTALYALGGEISVTYNCNVVELIQTETVRYFVSQGTALPLGTLTQFSTSSINIVNNGASIKSAWYHVDPSSSVATANLTIGHRVKSESGNSVGTDVTYALNTPNTRTANTPTLIHVLDESSSNYAPQMDLGGKYQFSASAGSGPLAVEAYVTFTWSNTDPLKARTKTVMFNASQKGGGRATSGQIKTESTVLNIAEHATKTVESAYLQSNYLRHAAASVTGSGTYTIGVGQSLQTINEGGIVRSHRKRLLYNIPQSELFNAPTSTVQRIPIKITQYYSGANNYNYSSNNIIFTYSTAFVAKADDRPTQIRTIEYILGGGSDSTARNSGETNYFGDKAIGASPSMLPIQLYGRNVRIVNAYLDVSFMIASTASSSVNDLYLTGSITGYGGSNSNVNLHENSGIQLVSTPAASTGYYHGQHDVTSLFSNQTDDGFWNRGDVQTSFGITTNLSSGQRTLTTMKLVLTYESDFNLAWHDETKTVRIPLQSSDSLGTRISACTMGTDCNFTYSKSIPDLVEVVSAHFDVRANINGTLNPNIYLASGGAQSPNYASGETNNDSTSNRYVWQIPSANLNATTVDGQTGTLIFHNSSGSALSIYGIGGELVVTYKYNTGSTKQLETVSFAAGQQTASNFNKTLIGTSTPYIVNNGATARDVWIRYYAAPYATGAITLYGKLGGAPERSLAMQNNITNRAGGDRYYYLNLTQDTGSFAMPSVGVAASIAFTSGAQYPAGAETFVNYVWDGSQSGPTTKTITYPANQNAVTNVTNAVPLVRQTNIYLPKAITNTFRGTYSRTYFSHSNSGLYGGTFALGPNINFGINSATSSIVSVGDLYAYNDVLIKNYNQDTIFGSKMPNGDESLRVENSAQTANPVRFSNEILISFDENQEIRKAAFTQDMFRIYVNSDSLDSINPWHEYLKTTIGENQNLSITDRPVRKADTVRLRMGITVGTSTMPALSRAYQLQAGKKITSCSAFDVNWQNVGVGGEWVGVDNPSLTSLVTITNTKLSKSSIGGEYVESGTTGANPNQVLIGQMTEYDFAIKRGTATPDSDYCFRMTESSGKVFDGYSIYPEIRTAGYTPETTDWRFYDDELNETPADNPIWLKNQTALSLANRNIIKLRIGLKDVANEDGKNEKYSLQYSTDPTFVDDVNFVEGQGACNLKSTFCYADSPSLGDDDDSLLSTSKLGFLKGRHNESTLSSTFSPAANTTYEMEYSIKSMRQRTGQVYYFRLFDVNRNIFINVNTTYLSPSVQAEGATLGMTISGVVKDTVIAENKMSSSTTDTNIPFGMLTIDTSNFLAQLLNIKTNAMDGYTIGMYAKTDLINSQSYTIPSISHINSNPGTWESVCKNMEFGCVGYHTTDATLSPSGMINRFSATNTWASLSTSTPDEIAFSDIPTDVAGDDVNIIYRIEPKMRTAPGEYSTEIVYVVTPVY